MTRSTHAAQLVTAAALEMRHQGEKGATLARAYHSQGKPHAASPSESRRSGGLIAGAAAAPAAARPMGGHRSPAREDRRRRDGQLRGAQRSKARTVAPGPSGRLPAAPVLEWPADNPPTRPGRRRVLRRLPSAAQGHRTLKGDARGVARARAAGVGCSGKAGPLGKHGRRCRARVRRLASRLAAASEADSLHAARHKTAGGAATRIADRRQQGDG